MGYRFSSQLTATLNLCLIGFEITWALAILLEHMHKKFEINRTKIKGGCQSGRRVVTNDSKSDMPLNEKVGNCLIFWNYLLLIYSFQEIGSTVWQLFYGYQVTSISNSRCYLFKNLVNHNRYLADIFATYFQ